MVSEELIGVVPEVSRSHVFALNMSDKELGRSVLKVKLRTNLQTMFPVSLEYNITPIDANYGTIYAAVVLLALYVLIIFEVRACEIIFKVQFQNVFEIMSKIQFNVSFKIIFNIKLYIQF